MTDESSIQEAIEDGARVLPDSILPLADTFCGCGQPDSAWTWVLDYLESRKKNEFRQEDQVGSGLIVAYLLDRLGLTTHGGSVGGAWLTERGEEVLAFLREHGADWQDGKWIGRDGVWRSHF